jgi:hypothetical protein
MSERETFEQRDARWAEERRLKKEARDEADRVIGEQLVLLLFRARSKKRTLEWEMTRKGAAAFLSALNNPKESVVRVWDGVWLHQFRVKDVAYVVHQRAERYHVDHETPEETREATAKRIAAAITEDDVSLSAEWRL